MSESGEVPLSLLQFIARLRPEAPPCAAELERSSHFALAPPELPVQVAGPFG